METIRVDLGDRSYSIEVSQGEIAALADRLENEPNLIVLSTPRVRRTCLPLLLRFFKKPPPVVLMPDGERSKNLTVVSQVYRRLIALGADRKTTLAILGGGVAGDVGGFVAATFLRGIPYLQIPTTLLAQVDSSIGGKVGVDLPQGKNLVGSFTQPQAVFAEVSFLKTLPQRELLCGLAEVVKYGVIRDPELFDRIGREREGILAKDPATLAGIVVSSARIKAEIVRQDERETTGLRRILNFGHTFGHALERLTGYRRFSHGEAVAIGMAVAARLSQKLGLCRVDPVGRILELLRLLGLPIELPPFPKERWLKAIGVDKKAQGGMIHFVFLKGIGIVAAEPIDPKELVNAL